MFEQLYSFIYNIKDNQINTDKAAEICGFFLKITLYLLVEKKKLVIDDAKRDDFLEQMDTLINSCISLIKLSPNIKTKKCHKFFNKIFKK